MLKTYRSCLLAAVAAAALMGLGAAARATEMTPDMDMDKIARGTAEAPVSVVREPTDLPPPLALRAPQTVVVNLETIEVTGRLDDGTSYNYWTFNGKVPGPFVRVRVGDTVEVRFRNADDSMVMHNVDFHAVTGPGGGGLATVSEPGQKSGFTFKALNPGIYVYHCATAPAAQHIAAGM
ncbi:MAG TPA: multicopper oxidase domain-containing protein, partial [Bauldia sp.]|nr:multicopper oxidase domain-containing protein [Bauldia sp.]